MTSKTPSEYPAGAPTAWTHVLTDAQQVPRTGTVWCLAPSAYCSRTFWVVPDQPLPGDPYHAVAVVKVARYPHRPLRSVRGVAFRSEPRFTKGELWSCDAPESVPGQMAIFAARQVTHAREARRRVSVR